MTQLLFLISNSDSTLALVLFFFPLDFSAGRKLEALSAFVQFAGPDLTKAI